MNHLCEMNFLVVVSVPFTTKNLLPLKGELLKDADACIKYLTLTKVFSKFNSAFFFFPNCLKYCLILPGVTVKCNLLQLLFGCQSHYSCEISNEADPRGINFVIKNQT